MFRDATQKRKFSTGLLVGLAAIAVVMLCQGCCFADDDTTMLDRKFTIMPVTEDVIHQAEQQRRGMVMLAHLQEEAYQRFGQFSDQIDDLIVLDERLEKYATSGAFTIEMAFNNRGYRASSDYYDDDNRNFPVDYQVVRSPRGIISYPCVLWGDAQRPELARLLRCTKRGGELRWRKSERTFPTRR